MIKCSHLRAIALSAALLALPASGSALTALPLDGGWQEFLFADVGSAWDDSFGVSIGAGETAWLAITDGFLSGDQFEFFANGVSLGLTSAPTAVGVDIGFNADAAFADARWSSAETMLGAGSYEITGNTVLSPFGAGRAFIRLSSTPLGGPGFENPVPTAPIPLPAAGIMLIGALGALTLVARRHRECSD